MSEHLPHDYDPNQLQFKYQSPFSTRYSSKEMQYLFSEHKKFTTWRKLWVILAEVQKELGLNITDEQINQLKQCQSTLDLERAKEYERKLRHDVMSHIHAYGDQCPDARPIIHLGATSCYVGDNTDIIIMHEALKLLKRKILSVIESLATMAKKFRDTPALSYTHLQPAQPSTIGKRVTLWIMDLTLDLEVVDFALSSTRLLGCKGTTGTQASFLELFNGDVDKVLQLDRLIATKLGFDAVFPVVGQTYPRKVDMHYMNVLTSIAQSAAKFSNDMRILQHLKEMEEPFESGQVGSSAMAYKRNPMRCERIAALSRYVICNSVNPAQTAATQWFERTLDDSANRRIAMAEAFLAVDGILDLYLNVSKNIVVYPKMVEKHLLEELPFMATENILMSSVKKGGDRQELHEKIRVHSQKAGLRIKQEGLPSDLIERIANDASFNVDSEKLAQILNPHDFIGLSALQVENFLADSVYPLLDKNKNSLGVDSEILL